MNKKALITGAVIALAAGIATFIYNKKRSKLRIAADDAYDVMDDTIDYTERQTEKMFS